MYQSYVLHCSLLFESILTFKSMPSICLYVVIIILYSKAGTGPKGYYRCRQTIATNLGKHRLTRHRSALPANSTSSRPRSWSLGNATLVVAERSGWRRALGASKQRSSAKGAHRYRKRACLEALRLATTKRTQRGTGIILRTPYPTQSLQRKHRTDSQMTTKARKRTMNPGLMKIGVWNVRGLYDKEKLLQEELKKANVVTAVISERKSN